MSEKYAKAVSRYNELAAASRTSKQARDDKAKAMNEVRAIEREAARDGVILRRAGTAIPQTAPDKPRRVIKDSGEVARVSPKRSLQEEYVRRFDDKTKVDLGHGPTTLQAHHAKRLLGR